MQEFSQLRRGFKPIVLKQGNEKELFFNGELVQDEKGIIIPEGDGFINIGYSSKNHLSRMLSNLYPYEIVFRDEKAKSIEGVLQAIKHSEPDVQKLVMQYSGLDAYHTRGSTGVDDWRSRQSLSWKNQTMMRDSEQYQVFLDELFSAAFENPLYAKAIKSTGDKVLLHSVGNENPQETVLTRNEYESRINSLKEKEL